MFSDYPQILNNLKNNTIKHIFKIAFVINEKEKKKRFQQNVFLLNDLSIKLYERSAFQSPRFNDLHIISINR